MVFRGRAGENPGPERLGHAGVQIPEAVYPPDTAFEKQIAEVAEKDLENLIYIQPNPYLSFNYESVITRFLQPALYEIETLDESLEKLQKETDILIQEGMETAKSLK